ncbi:MAG: flagellar hook assembly protein FlgD [Devosiaceae bacterium]|nr:flagellar hook assembly protein FlgD [Devosiaceae bacterium]
MALDNIAGITPATPSSLVGSRKSIADNFDTFLTLLTTQLKNQNPLEPLDTNAFTQQMVQFTSVEQQLKTNEYLEALVLGSQTAGGSQYAANNQAIGMIGKTVTAQSSVTALENGEASWTFTLGQNAPNSSVTIRNDAGAIVFSKQLSLNSGQASFEWDGKDESGLEYPSGNYSITIEARDSNDNLVTALTQVQGVVDKVDLTGDMPILMVGGSRINLDAVLSVS